MDCREFELLQESYLRGELNVSEEQAVEAHLENCSVCRQVIDDLMAASEKQSPAARDKAVNLASGHALDEEKQRKILRRAKHKNRFSIAVFLLLLLLGLRIAGGFLSSYYFNWGQEESRLYRTQQTAALLTEFSFPNVTLPLGIRPMPTYISMAGWGHSSLEIKPYFVARGSYALQKQVGKESIVIGYLNVNHLFSSILTQWQWTDEAHDEYLYFFHPSQLELPQLNLREGETTGLAPDNLLSGETWEALDILPEGTVAEMSVSFRQTYSLDQVRAMLEDYDLEITWYAVDTGIESKDIRGEHPEPLSAFKGVWGLPYLSRNMLQQYQQFDFSEYNFLLEKYFLDSMQHLVENEKIARRLYRGNPDELRLAERYNYIQENGIQVYGVVLTGPTKELLKLKELENIHFPALGEIQLWNWFQRNFRGTLY